MPYPLLIGRRAILSREKLMEDVWRDAPDTVDRTVDTHIKTLRAKLHALAPDQRVDAACELAVTDAAIAHVRRRQFGQRVGGIDQRVLHRLADAGLHFVDEHAHHEETGQADDQEISQEDTQADLHDSGFTL